jgi:deoxyribodipyrimidine photo-lyase
MSQVNLFWFRRDLRLTDNHGLYKALSLGKTICCFILDQNILNDVKPDDPKIDFIIQSLQGLRANLNQHGSDLLVLHGDPRVLIVETARRYSAKEVFANEDYEQFAITRDNEVLNLLGKSNIKLNLYQDQVVFAKDQILTKEKKPYKVYTPYKNQWLAELNQGTEHKLAYYPSSELLPNLYPLTPHNEIPPLIQRYGFTGRSELKGGEKAAQARLDKFMDKIDSYAITRDVPVLDNTSHLGVDLRFGTISVRGVIKSVKDMPNQGSEVWLNELIWREFFSQILYNFPHVEHHPFNREYEHIYHYNNQEWFTKWCNGQTGYPIVDAGMRQLNQTGFMHNRVRMICASFLTKDLLIDWRWGEKYFANKLLDYELSSNNGNWQWCASTGCDAQPYFRIFNPTLQSRKFDPKGVYIKHYVPELSVVAAEDIHELNKAKQLPIKLGIDYPLPIVNHTKQAVLAKEMFTKVVK